MFIEELKSYILSRISHCQKHIEEYPEQLDLTKYTCHGGWSKGYWEGRKSAFEDILDNMGNDWSEEDLDVAQREWNLEADSLLED